MQLDDGPREKLKRCGTDALSDSELLAVIIKTGNKDENVLSLAKRIIKEAGGLVNIRSMSYDELLRYNGIGPMKATSIIASFELYRRTERNKKVKKTIKTPKEAFLCVKDDYIGQDKEMLMAIYLDSAMRLINKSVIEKGEENRTFCDLKRIIRDAIVFKSSFVILVHNHPSGNKMPSEEDIKTTELLRENLDLFGIILFDHIIIYKDSYTSITYSL